MRFALLSALILMGSAGFAAEPVKDEKPSVAACATYGDNFYAVPGSAMCVAAGAIAELTGQSSRLSSGAYKQNQLVFHGALAGDARIDTGAGELRGFARVSYYSDSHSWTPDYLFVSLTGQNEASGQIGITDSTFNYLGGGPAVGTLRSANLSAKMIRLTLPVTSGLKFKVSMEIDPQERPRAVADPISRIFPAAIPSITSNDQWQPDLVAALSYEPLEGSAQLSGVLHRVQSPRADIPDQTGFAIQFGVTLPLNFAPPVAKDDASDDSDDTDSDDSDDDSTDTSDSAQTDRAAKPVKAAKPYEITHSLAGQIAYARGATLYLGYGTGRFSKAAVDAVVVPGGTLELITGVTAMGYYAIGWFPTITQNIFASWSQLNPPSAAVGFNLQGNRAYREGRLGTNFVYEPVKNFTITLEAMAMRADLSGILNGVATQIGNPTTAYQFSLQVSKVF